MARPNLRCPRNGKWTNRRDSFVNCATGRFLNVWEGLPKCAISPDTGQRGGCTPVRATVMPGPVGDDRAG